MIYFFDLSFLADSRHFHKLLSGELKFFGKTNRVYIRDIYIVEHVIIPASVIIILNYIKDNTKYK